MVDCLPLGLPGGATGAEAHRHLARSSLPGTVSSVRANPRGSSTMSKPPGVFALLVTAVTGFGSHLAELVAAGRDRLLNRPRPKSRPVKKR
jgi:hypothetical protein